MLRTPRVLRVLRVPRMLRVPPTLRTTAPEDAPYFRRCNSPPM
jgi:hypothetical protein